MAEIIRFSPSFIWLGDKFAISEIFDPIKLSSQFKTSQFKTENENNSHDLTSFRTRKKRLFCFYWLLISSVKRHFFIILFIFRIHFFFQDKKEFLRLTCTKINDFGLVWSFSAYFHCSKPTEAAAIRVWSARWRHFEPIRARLSRNLLSRNTPPPL